MTIDQLTAFLGWAALLNIIYMFLALSVVARFRDKIMSLHMRMFPGLKEEKLPEIYFPMARSVQDRNVIIVCPSVLGTMAVRIVWWTLPH